MTLAMRHSAYLHWFPANLLAAFAVIVTLTTPAGAQGEQGTIAKQAFMMDADTGAVLLQKNADELVPPASMSKLMTLVVVFKALRAGAIKADDEILLSVNAWRTGGGPSGTSAMLVPVNTREKLSLLIEGIIIQSGNDASIAIAEAMAGTEADFAKLMTAEARRIGLTRSTFRNSTGLYDPDHLMTMRELAILAKHLIDEYQEHYPIFAKREMQYRQHRFHNRNPLLNLPLGVDGLKTGQLSQSGFGIVASAKQGNRRLILAINGLTTAQDRRNEAARLLEWGFRSFAEFRLFDAGQTVGRARVWGGDRFFVPLTGKGDINVVLPRAQGSGPLKAEIIYKSPLKAPIRKGDVVAKLRVTTAANTVNEVPLAAAEDVERAGTMRRGLDTLVHMAFGWIIR